STFERTVEAMSASFKITAVAALLVGAVPSAADSQEATIRSTAVVDLSFDEAEGAAEDRASAGSVKDDASPMNGATRVTSPFWNAREGRAARFDAAKNQFFQIA